MSTTRDHFCRLLLAPAAILVLALAAMAPSLAAEKPIVVGFVGPLSPPGSYASGQEMKWAAQLAADEVNAAGGALGRQIYVIYEDTRGLPEQGTAAMERLIAGQGAVAVFGEYHSSVGFAEIEVAHNNGVPFIASEIWADKITGVQYPEVFRVAPTNSMIYTQTGNWVVAAGFKKVAIMQENTDWGVGAVQTLTAILRKKGIKYNVVTGELTQTEFTPQLLRWLNEKPRYDLLFQMWSGASSYALTRQACQLKFAPTAQTALYSAGSPSLYPEFWESVGTCGVHLIAEAVGLPKRFWNDKTKAFVAAYKKRYNRTPSPPAMEAYDSLYLIVQAIREAKTTNGKALVKELEKIRWTGTRGEYWFSTDRKPAWMYHQFPDAPVIVIQYDKVKQPSEEAPIIWPRKWSTVKYLYAKPKK